MSSCWGSGEDEYNNINPNINNGSDGRSIERANERTKLTKPVPIEKTANCPGGQKEVVVVPLLLEEIRVGDSTGHYMN